MDNKTLINPKETKRKKWNMKEREKIGNKYSDDIYEFIYIGNSIKYKWTKYPKKSLS